MTARGRIKVLLEPAPALIGHAGAIVVVCEVIHTHIEGRRGAIPSAQMRGVIDAGYRVVV